MAKLADLFASLEDEQENVIAVGEDGEEVAIDSPEGEAIVEETRNETDETAEEVTETVEKVEDLDEDTEDMIETAEGIDEIAQEMRTLIDRGEGMSVESAAFAHHAVNAYLSRIGKSSMDVMPSLESFGGDSGRLNATTISLEGLGEQLKKIYNAIKAAIERVVRFLGDLVAKIFGSLEKLKTRLRAIKTSAKGKKTESGAKFSPVAANTLKYKGSAEADDVAKGIKALAAACNWAKGKYAGNVIKYYEAMANTVTELEKGKLEREAEYLAENSPVLKALKAGYSFIVNAVSTDRSVLSGDKTVIIEKGEGEDAAATIYLGNTENAKTYEGKEVALPDGSKIITICDAALSLIDSLEGLRKTLDKDGPLVKGRKEVLDKIKKLIDDSDKGFFAANFGKAKGWYVMRAAQKDAGRVIHQLAAHSFSVARAASAYAEAANKKLAK